MALPLFIHLFSPLLSTISLKAKKSSWISEKAREISSPTKLICCSFHMNDYRVILMFTRLQPKQIPE